MVGKGAENGSKWRASDRENEAWQLRKRGKRGGQGRKSLRLWCSTESIWASPVGSPRTQNDLLGPPGAGLSCQTP